MSMQSYNMICFEDCLYCCILVNVLAFQNYTFLEGLHNSSSNLTLKEKKVTRIERALKIIRKVENTSQFLKMTYEIVTISLNMDCCLQGKKNSLEFC